MVKALLQLDGFPPMACAVYYFDLFDAQVSNGGVDRYFDNVAARLDDAGAVPGNHAARCHTELPGHEKLIISPHQSL